MGYVKLADGTKVFRGGFKSRKRETVHYGTHDKKAGWIADCGVKIPREDREPADRVSITCKRCLGVLDRMGLTHWVVIQQRWGYEINACGNGDGVHTHDTNRTTCQECKKLPGYSKARAEQLQRRIVHIVHMGQLGDRLCGSEVGLITFDPGQATCPRCLKINSLPSTEGQASRRILLHENG